MIDNIIGKVLLSPFSLLYGIGIGIRNAFYDSELVRSTRFSLPVVSVGNLSIGGAGKTPHIEHLIRLLSPYINVGTLSRGYKRRTSGFRFVNSKDHVADVGDEPLMYKRKYRGIVTAVSENRALGIPEMVKYHPDMQVILLDDAFQHRSVLPGLNILLTTYDQPFTQDFLLPSGRLREWRSSYKRADMIVVTKCPSDMDMSAMHKMYREINPQEHQRLYFSYYAYQNPYNFYNRNYRLNLEKNQDVILISAIANTSYLVKHLSQEVGSIYQLEYEDHHHFTDEDIDRLIQVYNKRDTENKIIITTEKDAMRLDHYRKRLYEAKIPMYILPIQVKFHHYKDDFDESVKSYLLNFKA